MTMIQVTNLKAKNNRPATYRPRKPVLRFTPYAWAKLTYLRDAGDSEVGGFGLALNNDQLLVEDFITVKQYVSCVSVRFDDVAVADYFDHQVDLGRQPAQFSRIWLHSHPGDSPNPSLVDERTFARVFGDCDWAVMFIVARGGQTHARLRFNVGPGGECVIPVEVDYSRPFPAADHEAWEAEYKANVHPDSEGLNAWDADVTNPHANLVEVDTDPLQLLEDLLEVRAMTEPADEGDFYDTYFDESEVFE